MKDYEGETSLTESVRLTRIRLGCLLKLRDELVMILKQIQTHQREQASLCKLPLRKNDTNDGDNWSVERNVNLEIQGVGDGAA